MTHCNSEFAEIEALPANQAGRILSARSIDRVRTLYNIAFPLAIVVAAGFLAAAAVFNRQGLDEEDQMKSTLAFVCGCTGILVFVAIAAACCAIGTRNHWLKRIACKEINCRSGKIVNPQNPDARFVEVVPRSNWNKPGMLENAVDVGFLLVDLSARSLFYEGDNERYRIPARAIVECRQDSYTRLINSPVHHGNQIITYHFVVVTIMAAGKLTVELPFRIRGNINFFSDKRASDANYGLFREVNQLRQTFREDGPNQSR